MTHPEVIVCVFAKPPRAGEVNTRLAPAVGLDGAARLARAFFLDTVAGVSRLPWARLVVATTGAWPDTVPLPPGTEVWLQGDGDLGQRLERVLRRALDHAPATLALGVDSPGLPRDRLEAARSNLLGGDAVLGPSEDGGFYTIGLSSCPSGLLDDIPWSASDTCEHTHRKLNAHGLDVTILPPWFDVDLPDDLRRLRDALADGSVVAPETARELGRCEFDR